MTLHRRVVTGDENSSVLDLLRTKKKRIAHKLSTPVAVKLIDKVGPPGFVGEHQGIECSVLVGL
jgi:hypothetical protein